MTARTMQAPHHLTNASAIHEKPTGALTPPHDSGLSITSFARGKSCEADHVTRAADTPPVATTDASPRGNTVAAREFHDANAASLPDGADIASATESAIHAAYSRIDIARASRAVHNCPAIRPSAVTASTATASITSINELPPHLLPQRCDGACANHSSMNVLMTPPRTHLRRFGSAHPQQCECSAATYRPGSLSTAHAAQCRNCGKCRSTDQRAA
jgi:hypothetical protein